MHVQPPRGTKGALSASGAMNQVAGRAQRLTVAAKTNTKFSTLEKSDAMKMATAAMKGIDPRRVSKRRWVWLARRAVKEYICDGAAWFYAAIVCHHGALMQINAVIDT